MKFLHGEDATHSPMEGQPVVIYTHTFRPEHYREGVELVTKGFPEAQLELGRERHNIFLKRPATHTVVSINFFDSEEASTEWHEYAGRLKVIDKMRPLLERPVDIQVYNVAGVLGIRET